MTMIDPPLQIHDQCQVRWRDAGDALDAIIIERRPINHRKRKKDNNLDINTLPADELEYYVHYINFDRRLDEWVTLDKFELSTLKRYELTASATVAADESSDNNNNNSNTNSNTRTTRRRQTNSPVDLLDSGDATSQPQQSQHGDQHGGGGGSHQHHHHHHHQFSLTGGNWHGGGGAAGNDSEMAAMDREHEEATKVKNIEKIVMGSWEIETWYYSPFPSAYCDLETLYVCEYCLTYMKRAKTYKRHCRECTHRHPPGTEIYREEDLSVYEIDGKEHRAYCQKLCLLAKLFLDHKTLYFETSPFMMYVVTKVDSHGAHIVGYFSKEKDSSEGYNLACILTFPQYQKCGYGKFIISLSYEITKREGKTGSPEKPLSDLGKVSYRSYWTHVLMHFLANHDVAADTNINEISRETGIRTEDLISTLQFLDMIKVWKGQHVIYVKQNMIRDYMKKDRKFRLCKPEYLKWEPPAAAKES